jgi:hypothetical protein
MTVEAFHKLTYQCRQSTQRLLKHWESTRSSTGTGRSIDAVITPAAPCPSFVPGQEEYIMYTVRQLRESQSDDRVYQTCTTCHQRSFRCSRSTLPSM